MSEHGATLQTYNQELVKSLEEMKQRRESIVEIISTEKLDKQALETRIKSLQDKLLVTNRRLAEYERLRDSYESIINETEEGFKKILDTSQTLLNSLQVQSSRLKNCEKSKK